MKAADALISSQVNDRTLSVEDERVVGVQQSGGVRVEQVVEEVDEAHVEAEHADEPRVRSGRLGAPRREHGLRERDEQRALLRVDARPAHEQRVVAQLAGARPPLIRSCLHFHELLERARPHRANAEAEQVVRADHEHRLALLQHIRLNTRSTLLEMQ